MRTNNNLERFWIVLKTNSDVCKVVKDFETLEECREFLQAGLQGFRTITEDEAGYNSHSFWYDIIDGDCENVVLNTVGDFPTIDYVEKGEDSGIIESTDTYYNSEPDFTYIEGEYTLEDVKFICENNCKYDVVFNDDTDSNSMGFKSTYLDCINYITMNKGTNHSYFEDYKGGSVCIVDVETGDDVYREDI